MERANLPYSSVTIDSSLSHVLSCITQCFSEKEQGIAENEEKLCQLWTTKTNSNSVLPCLSVRSALDLFLQSQAYPPGSEVLMSAVNIPDMAEVIKKQDLKIVPVDISIGSLEPKPTVLEKLITSNTVAILVAHLYGRRMDMVPYIELAKKYKLHIIEDCAECYSGQSYVGHPESDIALFSFGAIKFFTSFGGGVAKVRDKDIYNRMYQSYCSYPRQTNYVYLKKVLKYGIMYSLLHVWPFPQIVEVLRQSGRDYKELFITYLRGFPTQLIINIRQRPCPALLAVMLTTQSAFDQTEFDRQRIKGEYFLKGLTEEMWPVGTDVKYNSFWLFPVVVQNPEEVIKSLAALGMDAYRGTTQLGLIEPDETEKPLGPNMMSGKLVSTKESYPHEAKYMMDHVIYLPINKHVSFEALDRMMQVCSIAMQNLSGNNSSPQSQKDHLPESDIKSKL